MWGCFSSDKDCISEKKDRSHYSGDDDEKKNFNFLKLVLIKSDLFEVINF